MPGRRRTVEIDVSPGRIAAVVSVVLTIAGACFWIYAANASHEQTLENEKSIDVLAEEQLIRKTLWGEDYLKRISEVLRKRHARGGTGDGGEGNRGR